MLPSTVTWIHRYYSMTRSLAAKAATELCTSGFWCRPGRPGGGRKGPIECPGIREEIPCACSPLPSRCRLRLSRSRRRRLRPPDSENGRYSFNPVADGVLRLDTRTGQVSQCSRNDAGWACKVVPDERSALETE